MQWISFCTGKAGPEPWAGIWGHSAASDALSSSLPLRTRAQELFGSAEQTRLAGAPEGKMGPSPMCWGQSGRNAVEEDSTGTKERWGEGLVGLSILWGHPHPLNSPGEKMELSKRSRLDLWSKGWVLMRRGREEHREMTCWWWRQRWESCVYRPATPRMTGSIRNYEKVLE